MRIAIVFIVKIFEFLMFRSLRTESFRKSHSNNFAKLSNVDKVKILEQRRQAKGYRSQWLYYRCREEGLLNEYNALFKQNVESRSNGNEWKGVVFSFGKYKGQLVKNVWKKDKEYINWLDKQDWLCDYPDEGQEIFEIKNAAEKC